MNRLDVIKRNESLEDEIQKLREKEREFEIIRGKCDHDIVIVTDTWGCYLVEAKCLICGKRFQDSRSLREVKEIINMSKYKEDSYIFAEEKYLVVKKKYIDILTKNPDLSDSQITELIKKELKL